jgi:anti-sigma-K factor RskA
MTDRDDAHQLSGAYALHAVDAEEAALVEAAMLESEDFRSEVVGLSDTAVALAAAVPLMTPPPALRARLLDAIGSMPQQAAEEESADEPDREPVLTMPSGDHAVAPRRRRRRRPMALLAVAAAAVVLFGGGFFVQRALMEPQSIYTSINQAPDHRNIVAGVKGGGVATVVWSRSEHATAVVLNGVHAPSGRVLQLWTVRAGVATSAGLYQPTNDQRYTVISGTPSSGESLAVTVEPSGGSAQPTTQPIVKVPLDA